MLPFIPTPTHALQVGPAIITCRKAGIDVRMVTGDQLGTAVAIAEAAGILRDEDFEPAAEAPTGRRPRRNRAMEGAVLRECVYRRTGDGCVLLCTCTWSMDGLCVVVHITSTCTCTCSWSHRRAEDGCNEQSL